MRANTLVQLQLVTLQRRFEAALDDVTDDEWRARAMPNVNVPGFICWHIADNQDFIVQTLIRGVPELATQEHWAQTPTFQDARNDVTSLAVADTIAYAVSRREVQAYAAAVHGTIQGWLEHISDDEMEQYPDCLAHIAQYPAYQTGLRRQIAEYMATIPVADILTYYCCAHPYQHLGELALLKQVLRTRRTHGTTG